MLFTVFLLSFLYSCTTSDRDIASNAGASDFHSLCHAFAEAKGYPKNVCTEVNSLIFGDALNDKTTLSLGPKVFGAPEQKIDKKINYIVFNDANGVAALAYCYFVFREWIKANAMTPDDMGMASSGFSIVHEKIDEYEEWIDGDPNGIACKKKVQSSTGFQVPSLKEKLKGYAGIVAINPLAAFLSQPNRSSAVMQELKVTMNHERIHVYQAQCPALEQWGQKRWQELSSKEQKVISSKLNAYNWESLEVAGREYTAFSFESQPEKILPLVKDCQ